MYAESLVSRYRDINIRVLADITKPEQDSPNTVQLTIVRLWSRDMDGNEIVARLINEMIIFKPDVIHIHFNLITFGGFIKSHNVLKQIFEFASNAKIKTMVTLHSVVHKPLRRAILDVLNIELHTDLFEFIPRAFFDRYLKMILRSADCIVIPSIPAYDYVCRINNTGNAKIYCIPLGFEPLNPLKRVSENPINGKLNISFVGTLTYYKGVDTLLRAFARISNKFPSAQLIIFGRSITRGKEDFKYLSKLYKIVRKEHLESNCKIDIKFHTEEEIISLLCRSEIIVFPFRDDGILSMSASPYLAFDTGSKVIVTDVPRLYDFSRIDGFTVSKSGKVEILSDTIIKLIESHDKRGKLSSDRARSHLLDKVSEDYYKIISALCST